jgi:5-formyltetrahydrofolate cyclo-ligase
LPSPPVNRRWKILVIGKEDLRRKLRRKRKSLSPQEREEASEAIRLRLRNLIERFGFRRVLLFYPIDGEPDLTPLFDFFISSGELFLPKVVDDELLVCRLREGSGLVKGAYGIMEPEPCDSCDVSDLELVAVPGIAFDREGYRLGFGKGFYDRLLQNSTQLKVGVLFSFQLLDFIPRDPWDVPMDVLITERDTLYTKGGMLWKA